MHRGRGVAIFWCLAAAALFGASTPASKALLPGLGPLSLAGLLYLGAAVAVLPFSFRGGSRALRRRPRNILMLLGAVIFGGGLGPVLLLLGLSRAPAASVALWLNLETVATAVLAFAFFREHLDRKTWAAAFLVVAAGVLLAAPSGFGSASGAVLVALACLCWGLDNNLTALVDGFTPAQTTFVKGIVAGGANLSLAFLIEGVDAAPARWASALGVGALSYGVSIALYIRGAQHLGATRSQILFSTSPFLGSILAWTCLGEAVLPAQLAAAGVMLAALWLLLSARHEHDHAHDALLHTHDHRHDDGHHHHVHPGLPAGIRHTHEHPHEPLAHAHPHEPDLHHRHDHD
ncbi:MAG: DMT family transporter [Planctomycetes bacterium]|jgi:drug/metabolite transporter (DMT)-like permease|nr:DMT family transporter [Planctomycetota bacterium]